MSSPTPAISSVQFGPFELDLRSGDLKRNGRRERLQGQPSQLLVVLVSRRGELVTREELRLQLWPGDTFVDFDHGLNNAVNRIREVLGDSASSPLYIETVPRRGYRFLAEVKLPEQTRVVTSVAALAEDLSAPTQGSQRGLRRWLWILGVVGVLLAVGFGFIMRRQFTPATPNVKSLAVLPFVNFSGDPSQEYFADGMTEALIADLSRIRALKVVSRTSVMRYKGAKTPVPEIARELGVDVVIEGSVVREGGKVRVTAQLINGATDRHLWAENFQGEASGVLKLQSDIAQAISDRIQIVVTPAERSRLANAKTIDPKAYDAYLTGRYYWNRWDRALDKAIASFQRATELDPTYAPAFANLALAYSTLGFYERPRDVFPKAKAAALKALELDPELAEAHAAAGDISLSFDWDMQAADREWRRAIELDPNSVEAHRLAAYCMITAGRFDEALAEEKRALELDPFSANVVSEMGLAYLTARQYPEAIAQYHRALELEPNHGIAQHQLGWVYTLRGMYPQAYAEYAKTGKTCCHAFLGYLYAVSGRRDDAVRVLNGLLQAEKKQYVDAYEIAVVYTGLGDKDRAFQWLNKAFEERSTFLNHLQADPFFDSLRDDHRFAELSSRIGLPAFDPRKHTGNVKVQAKS
jgi:TolB-like protein/DNA-binding winged helix-turn-helix (wHTH) protein/Flp pilus assembly protein TadD